jgi:FAD/FMN-containing dehydrogenase
MSMYIATPETTRRASDPAGQIHYPGDASWDEARVAWNLTVDQRPAAVAVPGSAEEVASVIRGAARSGQRVTAQATGHAAGAYDSLADTILIKTTGMRGVHVDAVARRARVAAGALWLETVHAAAEHGLAALAGSSPDVGVVGYTLGGGISWLSRRYGLAANSVTAIELVTADRKLRRVDAQHDPDLF